MKKKIKLPNRDNFSVFFVKLNNENEYSLVIEEDITFRVISDNNNIRAIDPSGGPFICVGYEVDDYVVEKIYRNEKNGMVFVLKEIDKD